MGEVYRARDTRLAREVAIKVLSGDLASDASRLKRFEKEARAASALNHPNIVTVYDIGTTDGTSWIAMERVEGETVRKMLAGGPLPIKRLLQAATQIAEGLSRAHEAGIVHRDLKPENVMVTKDGLVKILDFGLAKQHLSPADRDETSTPTETATGAGVVLGTVGYMSPEQASGEALDFRSDQFSFGSVLYEMATGKRAFQKKTAIDTLGAILNTEPEPIASLNPQVPAPLRWIVERCLAKEPRQRYASTEDLARDLASVRDHISEISSGGLAAVPARRFARRRILGVLGIAALVTAAYFAAALRSHPPPAPRFQRISYQKGNVWSARFAPDGQTVVYGMLGVGSDFKPAELYSTRVGSLDSRLLGLPPADILSISRSGQMALSLSEGATLAEASLAGGAPRRIMEGVGGADWSPDGKELAIVHEVGGKHRLEYPVGRVLYESTDPLANLRVSPDGETVAFLEWRSRYLLRLVDRKGAVRTLAEDAIGFPSWSSRGDEIWWTKKIGAVASEVHAVTLRGRDRVVTSLPGDFRLWDIASDGRLLIEHLSITFEMAGALPGETGERSLAWLDESVPGALSADGHMLLFGDRGDTAGTSAEAVYLRNTDGSAAVRLGEGVPLALSPDGKWALALRGDWPAGTSPHLVLLPTGAGQEKALSTGPVIPPKWATRWARFHPDGKRIFFSGKEPGHQERAYGQSLEAGSPRPVTPEGIIPNALSPDGALLAAIDGDRNLMIFPTDPKAGTTPRILTKLSEDENPVHWNADGRSLLILDSSKRPIRVDRLDLASGRRTSWRSFSPGGLLGGGGRVSGLVLAVNEQAWVIGYIRFSGELLVIDGLK
jgi:Tol biopolymer transport system component/predicted Ser/Thr protein kinase